MESLKSYPWAESLKVSDEDFKNWQDEGTKKSFISWLLKNKPFYKKGYFNWAVDHYQIPFLEDMFFERHLMTKKEWYQVRDLAEWSEERLPVAVWKDAVFIGCLEPIKAQKIKYNFKHYFVLTSSHSLRSLWLFQKQLSSVIDQELAKSNPLVQKRYEVKKEEKPLPLRQTGRERSTLKKGLQDEGSLTPIDLSSLSSDDFRRSEIVKKKPVIEKTSQQETFTPDLPVEKSAPLTPPLHQAATAEKNSETHHQVLKAQEFLPELEEERITESDCPTFPGRTPNEEDRLMFMKSNSIRKSDKVEKPSVKPIAEEKKFELKVEKTFDQRKKMIQKDTDKELTQTSFSMVSKAEKVDGRFPKNQGYDKLWNEAKVFFYNSLVLKVRDEKAYFQACSPGMEIKETTGEYADFKDYSLFKVVAKGHLYNGFVVDTPANKKFFSQIGYSVYPKCVIAIPIKNEKQELKKIFMGFSASPLSRDKVRDIEKNILNFFQFDNQKLAQSA